MAQPQVKIELSPFLLDERGWRIEILKDQMIIGSANGADIRISTGSELTYDAILVKNANEFTITKTNPSSVLKVNGELVQSQALKQGDEISIRETIFVLHTPSSDSSKDLGKSKLKLVENERELNSNELENKANFSYIDNEYCDLDFSSKEALKPQIAIMSTALDADNFIDSELLEPIELFSEGKSFTENSILEIIFSTHGNILSFDSLPLKEVEKQQRFFSRELLSYLKVEKNFKLVERQDKTFVVNLPPGFVLDSQSKELSQDNTVVLRKEFNQITLKLGKEIGAIKFIPSSIRTMHETRKTLMVALLSFLPFLLLLLVNTQKIEEKKDEKVVIFKKKIIKKKIKLTEPVANKSDDSKNIDKAQNKVAKKVSEKKSEIFKVSKAKVSKSRKKTPAKTTKKVVRNNRPSQTIRSQKSKVSNKPSTPKVSLASSFSKMMGSSQVKSKSFAKSTGGASSGSSRKSGLNIAKNGALTTVGGGMAVGKLSNSGQFGSGKGFKSKGLGKSNFNSAFTRSKTVVLGSLDPKIIDRILREHMPQFRHCYQGELSRNANARGSINMDFTIGSSGRVSATNSSAGGNISRKTTGCIDSVLSRIQFPAPKGGGVVDVTKPLSFSASSVKI